MFNFLARLQPFNASNVKIMKLPVERWQEFRDLRLEALKTEPEVFGQSFTEKINEPQSYWQDRLAKSMNPQTTYTLFFAEYQGKLVGMIGAVIKEDTANIVHYYIKPAFWR